MFSLNKYFKNWQEKLFSKAPSSTRTTSKRRLKTKTLAEQTPQEQKRIQEIHQAFRQGKSIAEGELSFAGYCSLEEYTYYAVAKSDYYVTEHGLRNLFLRPTDIPELVSKYHLTQRDSSGKNRLHLLEHVLDYEWMKNNQKPLIVLKDALIYEINPQMSLEETRQVYLNLSNERKKRRQLKEQARKEEIREIDSFLPPLALIHKPLFEEICRINRAAPTKGFIPSEFTDDENSGHFYLDQLYRYAGLLQNIREKNGCLTKQDILTVDDTVGLSNVIDLTYLKIKAPNPHQTEIRFEALRFWADAVLVRTWKYGQELLQAEGFTPQEVQAIQKHPSLPMDYLHWKGLSHPFLRDIRVTEFWRGQKNQLVQKRESLVHKFPFPQKERQ